MLLKTTLISTMLASAASFAMPTGAIVPLGEISVNHPSVPGAVNSEKLNLSKIQVTGMSWLIECNYSIKGDADITAVVFDKNIDYNDQSEIFIDNDLYKNTGISSQQGKFVWGPIQLNNPEDSYLDVKNFDTSNDFKLTQCVATWVSN